MKTIIAGSRSIKQSVVVQRAIKQSNFHITEVFSGNARGVDTLGERWAEDNRIPIKYFPADWKAHQKSAGPIRNQAMANEADALIAVWDGDSRGTADMIHRAEKNGLLVFVYNLKHVAERRAKKCYICKLTAGCCPLCRISGVSHVNGQYVKIGTMFVMAREGQVITKRVYGDVEREVPGVWMPCLCSPEKAKEDTV